MINSNVKTFNFSNNKTKINNWLNNFFYSYYFLGIMLFISAFCWHFSQPYIAIVFYLIFVIIDLTFCKRINAVLPILFVITFIFKSKPGTDISTILFLIGAGLTFAVAFIFFICNKIINEKVKIKKGKMFYPLVLLMLVSLMGGCFSSFFRIEYAFIVGVLWLLVYVLYWILLNFIQKEDKQFILRCVIFGAVFVIVQMLFYYISSPNFFEALTHKASMIGVNEINIPAVFIAMAIPTLFYMSYGKKHSYLYILMAVIFYIFVFLTYSRGVILVTSLITLFCVIYLPLKDKVNRKSILYTYGYLMCAIIILMAILFFTGMLFTLFNHYIKLGLKQNGRFSVWAKSLKLFFENPVFGIGFYAPGNDIMVSKNPFVMPHNTILQLLTSSGIVGFIISVPYFIFKYKIMFKTYNTVFGFFALMIVLIPELYGLIDQTYLYITITMISILFVAIAEIDSESEQEKSKIGQDNKKSCLVNKNLYSCFFKRFFDIIISGLALFFLWPIMAITAIVVRIKLKGKAIFVQYRPGKNNKIFKLYKFRSMTNECDKNGNLLPDEVRLTPFGKKFRKTSLDELPQLWNIFKGDMSIIGPRPKLVKDMVFYNSEQNIRASVRAGLTGWAQVNGRNNITWEEIFAYDKEYVEKLSFGMDFKIFFMTIGKVFKKSDIVEQNLTKQNYYFGEYLLESKMISKDEYDEKQNKAKDIINRAS